MEKSQKEAIDFCLKLSEIFATIFVGFGLMALTLSAQIDTMEIGIYTSFKSNNNTIPEPLLDLLKPMVAGLEPKINLMEIYSESFKVFFFLSMVCLIIIIPIKFYWKQIRKSSET
jgi:hypothetical protein